MKGATVLIAGAIVLVGGLLSPASTPAVCRVNTRVVLHSADYSEERVRVWRSLDRLVRWRTQKLGSADDADYVLVGTRAVVVAPGCIVSVSQPRSASDAAASPKTAVAIRILQTHASGYVESTELRSGS